MEEFCDTPFNTAFIMTSVFLVTVLIALAVNVTLFVPAGRLTADGTVTSEGAPLTTATMVLLVALPDKLAVHDVDPGADTVAGAHTRPESTGPEAGAG